MKYQKEVLLNLPRERVIELFDNPENLPKWQKGLESFELIEGQAGQVGAKSKMVYLMGKRRVEMIETVTVRNLPDEFSGTYETKGGWNSVENYFTEEEGKTRWLMKTEFKFSGFMKLIAFLMPGMFKKETAKQMNAFKSFAESQEL